MAPTRGRRSKIITLSLSTKVVSIRFRPHSWLSVSITARQVGNLNSLIHTGGLDSFLGKTSPLRSLTVAECLNGRFSFHAGVAVFHPRNLEIKLSQSTANFPRHSPIHCGEEIEIAGTSAVQNRAVSDTYV